MRWVLTWSHDDGELFVIEFGFTRSDDGGKKLLGVQPTVVQGWDNHTLASAALSQTIGMFAVVVTTEF
jgi:hypothetical protein